MPTLAPASNVTLFPVVKRPTPIDIQAIQTAPKVAPVTTFNEDVAALHAALFKLEQLAYKLCTKHQALALTKTASALTDARMALLKNTKHGPHTSA